MATKKCQIKETDDKCAHELSKQFVHLFPILMEGDGKHFCQSNGFMRCGCGAAVRAKEVRAWAAKNGTKVNKLENKGTYIIFEYKNIEGGGHVWGYHNGNRYGNGYYDAYPNKLTNQQIYRM